MSIYLFSPPNLYGLRVFFNRVLKPYFRIFLLLLFSTIAPSPNLFVDTRVDHENL